MDSGEETPPRYYSIAEAAAQKGVCYRTVWRAVQQGKLRAIKAGRGVLIPHAAVAAWKPAYERAPFAYRHARPTAPLTVVDDRPGGEPGDTLESMGPSRSSASFPSERLLQPVSPGDHSLAEPDLTPHLVKRWLREYFLANPFLRDSAAGIAQALGADLTAVTEALGELAAGGEIQSTILADGCIVYASHR